VWNSSLIIFSCIFFRNNATDAFAVIHHIFTDFRHLHGRPRSGYFAEMVMGLFFATLAVATALFPKSMRFKYDNLYVVMHAHGDLPLRFRRAEPVHLLPILNRRCAP
jgi:hypothetical protein